MEMAYLWGGRGKGCAVVCRLGVVSADELCRFRLIVRNSGALW